MRAPLLVLLSCVLAAPVTSAVLPPEPPGECDMTGLLVCVDADASGSVRCRDMGDPTFVVCSFDYGAMFLGSSPAGVPGSAAASIALGHTACAHGDCVQAGESRELSCAWAAGETSSCGNEFETVLPAEFVLEPGECVAVVLQSQIVATAHAVVDGSPADASDAAVFTHADAYCSPA